MSAVYLSVARRCCVEMAKRITNHLFVCDQYFSFSVTDVIVKFLRGHLHSVEGIKYSCDMERDVLSTSQTIHG